jgi:hypothetical protein
MALPSLMPRTPGRVAALLLGGACSVSCITLLGEGFGHLRLFLPLALLNLAVGTFTSERVARAFMVLEACAIFGLLGYQLFHLHERHAT